MESPWGFRSEVIRFFNWTYDYLLWDIAWINVRMMMADSLRSEKKLTDEEEFGDVLGEERFKGETKSDIESYLKSNNVM